MYYVVNIAARVLSCFLLFVSFPLSAEDYSGEVLEYGYYAKVAAPTRQRNLASTSGYVKEGGEVKLAEQVDRIPIDENRLFGFKFKLSGFENKNSVQIKLVVKHPEITRPNGSIATEYSYPVILDVKDGVVINQTGYSLDHDYEMVEGEWVFEIWYYNQRLISKTFTTYFAEKDKK